MITLTPSVRFFLDMAQAQSVLTRRFDSGLNGLSLSEFTMLYHLSQAPSGRMRRTDLADAVGLTQSGITRLLAPMEKIGLIKREQDATDARVSYVAMASGGKSKFADTLDHAERLAEKFIPAGKNKELEKFRILLEQISR